MLEPGDQFSMYVSRDWRSGVDVLRRGSLDGRCCVVRFHELLSILSLDSGRRDGRNLVDFDQKDIRADDEIHGTDGRTIGSHDDALEQVVVVDLDSN